MTSYYVDDAFNPNLVEALRATWPSETAFDWCVYPSGKLASKTYDSLPVAAKMLLNQMIAFSTAIPYRLKIEGTMFPDVQYMHGAGLHQMNPGVYLEQHLDAAKHPLQPWRRVASTVLYLDNCDDGGELDFVDVSGGILHRIQPRKGRLAVFGTAGNYHRVNAGNVLRRSLCLFYWVVDHNCIGHTSAKFGVLSNNGSLT